MTNWIALSYCLGVGAQLISAAAAISIGWYLMKDRSVDTEEYLTARGSQSVVRIAWSMFASCVGAWVVSSVPCYASYTGIIGLVFYALASGIPVIFLAFFGPLISQAVPHVHSVADFARWRYGPTAKIMVALIVIFNLSINLTVEYTTIGSIFKGYVDGNLYPIVLSCAILTTIYTAYGGLQVGIITDQIQGAATIILVIVLIIYLAVTFREPLLQPLPDYLGSSVPGWSAVFVMPCSLICATIFSEAVWQRCWAAADARTLKIGSCIACALVVGVVFLFGIVGFLGTWAGTITADTNVNLYLFAVVTPTDTVVNSGIGAVMIMLACFMNIGCVDSLQTGITATVTSHFFKGRPLHVPRLITVLIQIPIVYVASQNYNALQLFVTTNMLTTTASIPLMIGLHPRSEKIWTENGMLFSITVGMLTITAYGIGQNWNPQDVAGSVAFGSWFAWSGNNYLWDYFFVALTSSSIAGMIWIFFAKILMLCGLEGFGISDVLALMPGWKYISGEASDEWYQSHVAASTVTEEVALDECTVAKA